MGTHGRGDLLRVQALAQAIPHQTARLAPHAPRLTSHFEDRESLRQPEELDESARVARRILAFSPYEMKLRAARSVVDPRDAPLGGDAIHRMGQVTFTDDERDLVEDLAVHVGLARQPIEAVPVRLDLVSV